MSSIPPIISIYDHSFPYIFIGTNYPRCSTCRIMFPPHLLLRQTKWQLIKDGYLMDTSNGILDFRDLLCLIKQCDNSTHLKFSGHNLSFLCSSGLTTRYNRSVQSRVWWSERTESLPYPSISSIVLEYFHIRKKSLATSLSSSRNSSFNPWFIA